MNDPGSSDQQDSLSARYPKTARVVERLLQSPEAFERRLAELRDEDIVLSLVVSWDRREDRQPFVTAFFAADSSPETMLARALESLAHTVNEIGQHASPRLAVMVEVGAEAPGRRTVMDRVADGVGARADKKN